MSAIVQPSRHVSRKGGQWLSALLDWVTQAPSIDESLKIVLAKPSDRLLVDAGLTRDDLLDAGEIFWSQWSREREAWHL